MTNRLGGVTMAMLSLKEYKDSNEDEDNISDEPDPDQLEFDFDTDHLKPN